MRNEMGLLMAFTSSFGIGREVCLRMNGVGEGGVEMENLVETIVNHDSVFGKRGREMDSLRAVLGQVRRRSIYRLSFFCRIRSLGFRLMKVELIINLISSSLQVCFLFVSSCTKVGK